MADKTTELERVYTIPLRKTKDLVRSRRADLAVRDVKRYLERHMKSGSIWLDNSVNEALWAHGKFSIPSRIRVRATRFSDGVVEVTLPESTATGSIREVLAERREKAAEAPVLKAPTADEEAGPEAGRPVTDVKGIGPATAEKLEASNIRTLADLVGADATTIANAAGVPAEKAQQWIDDAKDIAAGKTETADVKAQPALEAAKAEDAEAKPAGKAEKAEGKAEPKGEDKPKAGKPAPKKE